MRKLKILILTILLIAILAAAGLRYITSPAKPYSSEKKRFVIKKNESLISIAKRLEKEGIIKNRLGLIYAVKKLGIENKIQAGSFVLSPKDDVFTIAKALTKGTDDIWVTIIEGLRKEEIAEIYQKQLGIPTKEFLNLTRNKEGYLFPDTYLFPKQATAKLVVNTMLKTFDAKVNQNIRSQIEEKGLSFEEGLILASLVEREAKSKQDKIEVASVLLKRLKNDWPLQVDATIQYALGYDSESKSWWKKNLTKEDLQIDSPYNTYKNKGLPPAPICNPGLDSILAVAQADENTPYWFYLSDKTGKTHFSKTLEEHNEKIRKYLK